MKKKKSVIRRLLPWVIALAAIAALVIFVGIPLYGPQPVEEIEKPQIVSFDGGKKALKMENDHLLFELDPKTTQFTLTEKATGRLWRSNPENAKDDKVAANSAANRGVLQSTLIVTYASADGVIDYNNFQYSIENGNYTVAQLEDGSVEATYTVGKIEKTFILPTAITVDRFQHFTGAMAKAKASRVKKAYTQYTPEKIAKMTEEEKAELFALYPEAQNQALYVLIPSTSEGNKESIAEIFAAAGYTQEDYDQDMLLVAGAKETNIPVFNVTIRYYLDGEDFVAEIPYERIRYRADYPITYVTVLPMFGAAGAQEEGFMLLPEGGGALIRYNNGKLKQNSYYANMYGWDYATERTEVVSETKSTFPVFGMTGQGGAFICIMEGAASYGGVQADISMRYNSYNWMCAKYHVLHSDRYNVSAKTENLVYMFEKHIPDDTVVQRYRFVDSADYAAMATAYGDYLRDTQPALAAAQAAEDMPVTVEFIGAIDKTMVKMGMPVESVVATTTFAQAEEIMADLKARGVKELNIRMSGWANGGVSQEALTGVNILRELGGKKAMDHLIAAAREQGIDLYFDGVSCFVYNSDLMEGFIPYRDAARYTTREQVVIHPYSAITYQPEDWREPFYLVQPRYAHRSAQNLIAALSERQAAGTAFRDIGSLLSGDYNPKDTTTREQVLAMNLEILRQTHDKGMKVMVKEGFDYVLPYADMITDMDLRGMDYSIIDQKVPFYQMAIHGAVDYTGEAINLARDWKTELLRCAEYGAGLNFTFMHEEGTILQNTFHSGYYGAEYAAWQERAGEIAAKYQADMAGLNRIRMTGHEILTEGVTATEYENGAVVWVNYTDEPYQAGDITVPAGSYHVQGGDRQ